MNQELVSLSSWLPNARCAACAQYGWEGSIQSKLTASTILFWIIGLASATMSNLSMSGLYSYRDLTLAYNFLPLQRLLSSLGTQANSFPILIGRHRALVLDGPNCKTVEAIRSCKQQLRQQQDMVVPNNCTSSYMRIAAKGLCNAHHGSLRCASHLAAPSEVMVAADNPSCLVSAACVLRCGGFSTCCFLILMIWCRLPSTTCAGHTLSKKQPNAHAPLT